MGGATLTVKGESRSEVIRKLDAEAIKGSVEFGLVEEARLIEQEKPRKWIGIIRLHS